MKNSWHKPAGRQLKPQESRAEKFGRRLTWPWVYLGLILLQGKDVLSFGCYWLLRRKNPDGSDFSAKSAGITEKKCRTRTRQTKSQQTRSKNDKILTKRNLPWVQISLTVVLSLSIVAQLPLLEKNWRLKRERENSETVRENHRKEYLPWPDSLNFDKSNLIEIGEKEGKNLTLTIDASREAQLTQKEILNLALSAFYSNNWIKYQEWLEKAQLMDPNEQIFAKTEQQ